MYTLVIFNMVLAKDTKLQRCDVLGIAKKNENPRVLCIIWYYGNNCTIQYLGCLWTTTFRFFLGVLFVQSVVKEWFPLNLGMCRRERLLGSGESDAQLALAGWVLRLRW